MRPSAPMHGGDILADVLERHGVRFLFTLCGGHISPILVGAKSRGIRVIDVRHEATAVFAADAVSRLTGIPGVAAVTAGPGVTNTITAVKNAQLAQSPLILLGGATATLLRGRGALQDIDQMALVEPHVKLAIAVKKVRDLGPSLSRAFRVAQEGVPGPVFVECPVDLLYDEKTVREMYGAKAMGAMKGPQDVALQLVLRAHLARTFRGASRLRARMPLPTLQPKPDADDVARTAALLREAKRPVILLGSQSTFSADRSARAGWRRRSSAWASLRELSGMARGLLKEAPLFFRYSRAKALSRPISSPCRRSVRLCPNYGLSITRKAKVVAINRDHDEARKNRRPTIAIIADPAETLPALAALAGLLDAAPSRAEWFSALRARDDEREREIAGQAKEGVSWSTRCTFFARSRARSTNRASSWATAATCGDGLVHRPPRSPLSWPRSRRVRDPRRRCRLRAGGEVGAPRKRRVAPLGRRIRGVWAGRDRRSSATASECSRSSAPTRPGRKIARDQVTLLGDEAGTALRRSDYHVAAEGLGAKGVAVTKGQDAAGVLEAALAETRRGTPVQLHIARTDFRKGVHLDVAGRALGLALP